MTLLTKVVKTVAPKEAKKSRFATFLRYKSTSLVSPNR